MTKWISQVKFWIFSMTYGPGLLTPPSTLRPISGTDFANYCLDSYQHWSTRMMNLKQILTSQLHKFSPSSYPAKHRVSVGPTRQTRAGLKVLKATRLQAADRYDHFKALLETREKGTVGVAYYGTPSRAYRQLSTPKLYRSAAALVRRYRYEDDEYEQVP
jgi:hypothetical protein